jgi:hypothetical protein
MDKAVPTLAKVQACLLVFEGAIEFQLIVHKPTRREMDVGQPFVIMETLGDCLGPSQDANGLFISALEPHHLCLGEANVDPLPFSLVSLGKTT